MNNKVRKALYSLKGFLKNSHFPIPYKRILFSAIVIGQVSYSAPLLGSNKERTRSTWTLVNFRIIKKKKKKKKKKKINLRNLESILS